MAARCPHSRRKRRVGEVPMDTEFPGEMKPEDTKELRESSVDRTMSNEHLLTPNCAIVASCV